MTDDRSPATGPAPGRPKLQRQWEFDDPAAVARRHRWRRRAGAGAIVAAIGLLAWGLLERTADARLRRRAYATAILADLHRLRDVEQAYFDTHGRYGTLEDLGMAYISSQGVRVRIHAADSSGWNATAWHLLRGGRCIITVGVGPAALADPPPGVPDCR